MKKLLVIISAHILISSSIVYSQSDSNNYQKKLGIGLTLLTYTEFFTSIMGEGMMAPTIYIPVKVSPKLRIEPEIGYFRFSSEQSDQDSKSETKGRIFQIGVGFCPMISKNNFDMYYGGRIGYLSYSSKDEYVSDNFIDRDEESGGGFYLSPILGGEYHFSNHFSVGGEVQLKYSDLDFEEGIGTDKEETGLSRISTNGIICIRIYF